MTIDVTLGRSRTTIERQVFVDLFENSVVNSRKPYGRALALGKIAFTDLVELARTADIPYPLFFAPYPLVQAQLDTKTAKLLQGVTKRTFSLNSRTTVNISDIELIIKDLVRKQQILKKYDTNLDKNPIAEMLRIPGRNIHADATKLMNALNLDHNTLRSTKNKTAALNLIIKNLEERQVLVSRSVNGFMPQSLKGIQFSGITIRDSKVPYIFLAGGAHGDYEEPEGRQIFTLTLLAVLVACGVFAPVTYNGRSTAPSPGREYEIVGQILMPSDYMRAANLSSLAYVRTAADELKVTPSAVTVRAMRLGLLSRDAALSYLEDLADEFSQRPKSQARTPNTVNGVRKYNGREFSVRMLEALDSGKLGRKDFCRQVSLNKLRPSQIGEFREALR